MNQPKSTVELGYLSPRGLTGPPAVTHQVEYFLFSYFVDFPSADEEK